MEYERARWMDLGEEEQREALGFVPEMLAVPLRTIFKSCVMKEEEEDGDAFILGELGFS